MIAFIRYRRLAIKKDPDYFDTWWPDWTFCNSNSSKAVDARFLTALTSPVNIFTDFGSGTGQTSEHELARIPRKNQWVYLIIKFSGESKPFFKLLNILKTPGHAIKIAKLVLVRKRPLREDDVSQLFEHSSSTFLPLGNWGRLDMPCKPWRRICYREVEAGWSHR